MISHLDTKISQLYERFFLNPLQFFGEKEIHYVFAESLQELIRDAPKWRGAKLWREFPTTDRYGRKYGCLLKTNSGRSAFIDLVIKHPDLSVGFEFYISKETVPADLHQGYRYYWLRKSSVSPKRAIRHARNDWLKLSNQRDLDMANMIIFIAGFSYKEEDRQRFIRNKQKPILTEFEKLSKSGDDRIRILYCERYCVDSLKGNTNRFMKQFGY